MLNWIAAVICTIAMVIHAYQVSQPRYKATHSISWLIIGIMAILITGNVAVALLNA
jgi:hypothetical protein